MPGRGFRRIMIAGRTAVWIAVAAHAGNGAEPSAVRGESVYLRACAACHGDKGDGAGPAARYLDPRPREFVSGVYKFRSTGSGELPTDADLVRVVTDGVPRTQMPGWKDVLTDQEIRDVVAYIKTFNEDFGEWDLETVAVPEPPEATPALIDEGRMVYMMMECWACHGPRGKGDGPSRKDMTDDWGHAIVPWDLTRNRYKAGNSPKDIYRTFSTGLNGTPMPAYVGVYLYGNETANLDKNGEVYAQADIDALRQYLQSQPSLAAIERMDEQGRKGLEERRKWALVHYVRSLAKKTNIFVRLFWEDTELTQ